MNEVELLGYVIQTAPAVFQTYRIWKKSKKIISKDAKQTAINLLKISFYEIFLVYDLGKWISVKLKAKSLPPDFLLFK